VIFLGVLVMPVVFLSLPPRPNLLSPRYNSPEPSYRAPGQALDMFFPKTAKRLLPPPLCSDHRFSTLSSCFSSAKKTFFRVPLCLAVSSGVFCSFSAFFFAHPVSSGKALSFAPSGVFFRILSLSLVFQMCLVLSLFFAAQGGA